MFAFLEGDVLVLGPQSGEPEEATRIRTHVVFRGERVGELWVDDTFDRDLLERVALLVSAHVLVGWDTGGEAREP